MMTASSGSLAFGSAFPGDADRLSSDLLAAYYRDLGTMDTQTLSLSDGSDSETLLTDPAGRVGVVITAVDPDALVSTVSSMGMQVAATLASYHRIEGFVSLSDLPAISQLAGQGLLGITAVPRPIASSGSVNSQADNILEADRVRASVPGYNGAGVKIGVLSDSYDRGTTRASASVSSGNLPNNVQVLDDTASGSDEGRAMLELIYDLAPGAGLGFATAFNSEASFAANIQALANAGYKVISDDISYFDEPFFQDGILAQAVNNVVNNNGVSYFSSAGNIDTQSYDTGSTKSYGSNPLNFITDSIGTTVVNGKFLDFDPGTGVNDKMSFSLPRSGATGYAIVLSLQWDQPFYTTAGVTSNIDVYLVRDSDNSILASATTNNLTSQTPLEIFGYGNSSGSAVPVHLMFRLTAGTTPGRIKFENYGSNSYGDANFGTFATNSGTINSHSAAAGAMSVAASAFYQQNLPEAFSSNGPTTILFNADGTRKATAEIRAKPDILATDGADTSFFGSDIDGNGFFNFFGTSAAAPHAAAVAALVIQANPSFTPSQVYARMKSTADPTIGTGNPNVIGAGQIDAYRAIFGNPVPVAPTITDGFESGALGTDWQVYRQGSGLTQVISTLSPATGVDQLVLGQNLGFGNGGFNVTGLNEAILHANLAGKAGLVLSFAEKKFSNEGDSAMPASFTGHGNYDGVAISVDGVNWYRLITLTGTNSTTAYQNLTVDVSAAAASLGLTLTSDTLIKFQEYNATSYAIGVNGIALDNILLSAQTTIAATAIDNGTAQRSRVRSITVDFSGQVVSAPSSAFTLVRTGDSVSIPVTVSSLTSLPGGGTRAVLTFGGPTLEAGSLSDGRYVLSIDGSSLTDAAGRSVDADGNGVDGGTGTVSFFRFFGDSNGDGVVDANDYLVFLTAYKSGDATGLNAAYDFNGDGSFTSADLSAFLLRFNKRRLP